MVVSLFKLSVVLQGCLARVSSRDVHHGLQRQIYELDGLACTGMSHCAVGPKFKANESTIDPIRPLSFKRNSHKTRSCIDGVRKML